MGFDSRGTRHKRCKGNAVQVAASAELTSRALHDKVLVVFGGLLLVMLLAALDSTIVATALPTIVGEFGGLAHISWVVTAYCSRRPSLRLSTENSAISMDASAYFRLPS